MVPRNFSTVYGFAHASPQFLYIYDPASVVTGDNPPVTGAMRAATPADFTATINVSGLNLSVGAVALTGTTNNVVINSGTYTPNFLTLTAGQGQIPAGVRQGSIYVSSGVAFVNGSGPLTPGTALKVGGYDGRFLSTAAVNVGCTGGVTVLTWET